MGSRRNNLIVLGLVAILIVVAAYLIFIRQPVTESTQLGLDLEGGVSVQLQGYQTDGSEVTRNEMERAVQVIGRTAQLGFYEVLAADGGQPVPEDEVKETEDELRESLREDEAYKK